MSFSICIIFRISSQYYYVAFKKYDVNKNNYEIFSFSVDKYFMNVAGCSSIDKTKQTIDTCNSKFTTSSGNDFADCK